MIEIDGSYGEGGGQIIRTSLALSVITKEPFTITKIRNLRPNPGLQAQHLACIKAASNICDAKVNNATLGATSFEFYPNKLQAKNFSLDIETAGSITLVMQSFLLPLLLTNKKSKIEIIGGTDVKWSMSFDYYNNIVLPHLKQLAEVDLKILKRGYYPTGQGKIEIVVKPKIKIADFEDFTFVKEELSKVEKIKLSKRGKLLKIRGISYANSNLQNTNVAERVASAASVVLKKLNCPIDIIAQYSNSESIGCGIFLMAQFANDIGEIDLINPIALGSDELGDKTKTSETIGEQAARKLIFEIESNACVDEHLADNLIPLLGLIGGEIKVSTITKHCLTNIYVTEKILGCKFSIVENIIKREEIL